MSQQKQINNFSFSFDTPTFYGAWLKTPVHPRAKLQCPIPSPDAVDVLKVGPLTDARTHARSQRALALQLERFCAPQ